MEVHTRKTYAHVLGTHVLGTGLSLSTSTAKSWPMIVTVKPESRSSFRDTADTARSSKDQIDRRVEYQVELQSVVLNEMTKKSSFFY
jgi:hypothetical protein